MLGNAATPKATSDLYDQRYAGDYMDADAFTVWDHSDLCARQVIETLSHVRSQPRRVLDYGCGVGRWVDLLSRAFPRAEVAGVDISKTAIGKATNRFPRLRFETLEGGNAPFASEEFDVVFSYHVLEHVDDIDSSIADIARMCKHGGYAVIIFPCGNEGSFLDRTMKLLKDARVPTSDGRTVLFFEIPDGHVRRMTSRETIAIFQRHRFELTKQLFAGHFFGTVDWLTRGTGPAYINRVFTGKPPVGRGAKIWLGAVRRLLLGLHRLILLKSLDTTKKRTVAKQSAVFLVKHTARLADRLLNGLISLEWGLLKYRSHGTAQYLVFRKM